MCVLIYCAKYVTNTLFYYSEKQINIITLQYFFTLLFMRLHTYYRNRNICLNWMKQLIDTPTKMEKKKFSCNHKRSFLRNCTISYIPYTDAKRVSFCALPSSFSCSFYSLFSVFSFPLSLSHLLSVLIIHTLLLKVISLPYI